ncbi:cbb3-type cytochrome oxidase assembly protein CcoS [Candidatus Bandiella euplotis]|uniref:Cytochrome oxidase maturation protein cbb3-type n=1 Tax=Candidatus Bandiella euplotis TaxID=1664265 RepID=A0ABZ0UJZ9_9RICK|nr:cbb3-type cytochrome oxidase assembly protein CcoS [Candidatus Bandiella woodruffii]WPX96282.1 Cytochrome oxidase maturation protein cbb3-type [Candidatus Bandiella woodruffii]
MSVLLFLIPIAAGIAFLGVVGIFWSIKHNQFEDLKGASQRILYEKKIVFKILAISRANIPMKNSMTKI